MSKTKRVYRFGHGCGCARKQASRPVARPGRPGDGCIRNPRTSWVLRLHSCRALSSQSHNNLNPLLTNKEQCNPCARVLPMSQGESVTHVSEHSGSSPNPCCTALFHSVPRNQIFLQSTFPPAEPRQSQLCFGHRLRDLSRWMGTPSPAHFLSQVLAFTFFTLCFSSRASLFPLKSA
jgi:hypothetical protein